MAESRETGGLAPMSFEEYLKKNGTLTYTFRGVSMMPMLRQKRIDLVTIKRKEGRLRKYDVALYRSASDPRRYVLHRVIGVKPDGYIIRGDNCISEENIPEEQVIGVLQSFHRGKGGLFGDRDCTVDGKFVKAYARVWVFFNPALKGYRKLRAFGGRCYRKLTG